MKLNYLIFSLSLLHMSESEVELLSTQYLQFIFTLSFSVMFSPPCRQNERLSLHSGPRWLLDWDPKSQQYGVHHLLKMNPCNLLQCESSGLLWVQGFSGRRKDFLGGVGGMKNLSTSAGALKSIRSGITCTMAISLSKHKMDCSHTVDQHFGYLCYPSNYFPDFVMSSYSIFSKSDVQEKR